MADESGWPLKVGESMLRRDLHKLVGGNPQAGMTSLGNSDNVLLVTGAGGKVFGYGDYDGWLPSGEFQYTGAGQYGDHVMKRGNKLARDHLATGKRLRLVEKVGRDIKYIGEFRLPNEAHITRDEGFDPDGLKRSVLLFRLVAVGTADTTSAKAAPSAELVVDVPIEAKNVTEYIQQRKSDEPVQALRREAELVGRFIAWVEVNGQHTNRQKVATPGGHAMYTDVFISETLDLIEAKASSSRHHIRTALGQVLDYARYVDHKSLAVLTPIRPTQDLIDLLIANGIGVIWETEDGGFDSQRVVNQWAVDAAART